MFCLLLFYIVLFYVFVTKVIYGKDTPTMKPSSTPAGNRPQPLITRPHTTAGRRTAAMSHANAIMEQAIEKSDASITLDQGGGGLREFERALLERPQPVPKPARPALAKPSGDALDGLAPRAVFRHHGDFWTVGFQGQESSFRDRKGLHYIAGLLRRPGAEVRAMDLIHGDRSSAAVRRELPGNAGAPGWRSVETPSGVFGESGPMLDQKARSTYEQRLAELREEREAAEAHGDEPRANRVEAEMEALRGELGRALDLRGRGLMVAAATERARVNATRSIRLAVERITDFHPELGRHLDLRIKTGWYCCYRPDRARPITWIL